MITILFDNDSVRIDTGDQWISGFVSVAHAQEHCVRHFPGMMILITPWGMDAFDWM